MATTLDLGNVVGPKGEKGNDGATWLNGAAAPLSHVAPSFPFSPFGPTTFPKSNVVAMIFSS